MPASNASNLDTLPNADLWALLVLIVCNTGFNDFGYADACPFGVFSNLFISKFVFCLLVQPN